jgi:hypothetical protein
MSRMKYDFMYLFKLFLWAEQDFSTRTSSIWATAQSILLFATELSSIGNKVLGERASEIELVNFRIESRTSKTFASTLHRQITSFYGFASTDGTHNIVTNILIV